MGSLPSCHGTMPNGSEQEVTSCSPGTESYLEQGRAVSNAGGSSRDLDSMWVVRHLAKELSR